MNILYINKIFPNQKPEKYYGNREYKRILLNNNNNNIQKKASQMLFRIMEGNGKALYILGIDDNGTIVGLNRKELSNSIKLIKLISSEINSKIEKIYIYKGGKGHICSVHILLPKNKLNYLENVFLIN
jgi:elongation factor 1-alpha